MPINEKLANRVREAIADKGEIEEKKMFSGMCFMLDGKMCICINKDEIMCRIKPEAANEALEKPGTRPMIHNGRTMRGVVYVNEEFIKTKKQLDYWVQAALEFNKVAKPSKPKKKKVTSGKK